MHKLAYKQHKHLLGTIFPSHPTHSPYGLFIAHNRRGKARVP